MKSSEHAADALVQSMRHYWYCWSSEKNPHRCLSTVEQENLGSAVFVRYRDFV